MADMQETIIIREGDALSVTDMQIDFLPGGALAVPGGEKIIPSLNHTIEIFQKRNRPIFFTRDWHPVDHISFKEHGGPWPPHCVQNTPGAAFHPDLRIPEGAVIVSKADKRDVEEYSTFFARDSKGQTEKDLLEKAGTRRFFIGGLATDYCVVNTVREARQAGLDVYVLVDAVGAVNVNPDDGKKAFQEMKRIGAKLIVTGDLA